MRQGILKKLRASSIAFLILLNWIAVPVAFAVDQQDACAMVCCIEDGYCCCTPSKPSVRKDPLDPRDHIDGAQLTSSCPSGCATTQASSQSFLRALARTADPQLRTSGAVSVASPPVTSAHEEVRSGPLSPRPP
ncbi:MAG TPA: hypothetical protein VFQ92_04285, partial [Blastocatellia bacterium]|nr:hypothetical protein [Blastocatellia bacterium]